MSEENRSPKRHIEEHSPGQFCWPELATTDTATAKAFYSGLFGWAPEDQPIGDGAYYTMLKLEGRECGALYQQQEEERKHGAPPHWTLYVAVENADAAAAKATELGGAVLAGPMDVFDAGRMAVIRDPEGAVICVWQAKNHIGTRIAGAPGTLCWSELATRNFAGATEFYTKLFGWGAKVSDLGPMKYTEWQAGGRSIGGMMEMTPEFGEAPPHWMPYFLVTNCDASAAKVITLGGKVEVAPRDIPNAGRFAVLVDPQGVYFSIFQGCLD